jgi:hypothetical protein
LSSDHLNPFSFEAEILTFCGTVCPGFSKTSPWAPPSTDRDVSFGGSDTETVHYFIAGPFCEYIFRYSQYAKGECNYSSGRNGRITFLHI